MSASPNAAASHGPVFVGGCPRSGTTMVRTMLNAHPQLAMPHETRFVVDAWRRRRRWGDLSDPERRRELAEWVVGRRESRVKRLAPTRKDLVETMVQAGPTIGSVLGAGFVAYAQREGKPRWGDKRPSYVLNLDAVFAMFPDAQFVNVVRDPRAAVASIRKVGWWDDGLIEGTELWERSLRSADRWRRRLGPDRFLELRYETVVADPEPSLRTMVEFLGLDPAGLDRMLAFHEHADIRAPRMHPLVSRPVTTETVRSWDAHLGAGEIAFVEHVLAGPMARYGYEPEAGGVDPPDELRARLRARRRLIRRRDRRTWLREQYLRVAYRRPVAAV